MDDARKQQTQDQMFGVIGRRNGAKAVHFSLADLGPQSEWSDAVVRMVAEMQKRPPGTML